MLEMKEYSYYETIIMTSTIGPNCLECLITSSKILDWHRQYFAAANTSPPPILCRRQYFVTANTSPPLTPKRQPRTEFLSKKLKPSYQATEKVVKFQTNIRKNTKC